MLIQAMVSSVSNHWCTPPDILAPVREINAGVIDFDPCSNPASIVDAEVEYMLERGADGLRASWHWRGYTYVNSPWGRCLGPWANKTVAEGAAGAEIVSLTPSRTGSGWCQTLLQHSDAHCFLKGRLKFIGARAPLIDGGPVDWSRLTSAELGELATIKAAALEPAPFDCMVTYFGRRPLAFRRAFNAMGIVEVHPRRRARIAWHCDVLMEMADGEKRWQRSRALTYTQARDEVDQWTARGYLAQIAEGDDGR